MSVEPRPRYRFRDFELDVAAFRLSRKGQVVRLERQPLELLILLVEHRDRLLERDAIADHLWGKDVFVDVETGVHTAVRKIRRALRDSAERPRFIEAVPGKGYRFVAAVEVVDASSASDAAPSTSAPPPEVPPEPRAIPGPSDST